MAEYERLVRSILKDNGWEMVRRGKGDNDIWKNKDRSKTVVVDGKIKSRYMANIIMKEAGIE